MLKQDGEINKHIAKRIKGLREKHEESQEQLGEAIGFSQTMISKIEKGKVRLTPKTLCDIAEHFNVSYDYLMAGIDNDNILLLLDKYVSLSYSEISLGDSTLKFPKLKINGAFYDYIVRTARANSEKYLPNNIRQAWIEQEKETFYKELHKEGSKEENRFKEFESFALVPEALIYPDDNKENWNQVDLLREMNKLMLKETDKVE